MDASDEAADPAISWAERFLTLTASGAFSVVSIARTASTVIDSSSYEVRLSDGVWAFKTAQENKQRIIEEIIFSGRIIPEVCI
jgi:hypothetical protein